jgi:phosphatidylglycerophosphate synthase
VKASFLTLPNFLTSLRLLLIAPIWALLQRNLFHWAFCLIIIAFATDFLDGFCARKHKTQSLLGAWLDPFADKMIVLMLLFFFFQRKIVPPAYFYLSTVRDVSQVMGFPMLMLWKRTYFKVKPKLLPKLAAVCKFVIILFCVVIVLNPKESVLTKILFNFMLVSACLEVYVLLLYMRRLVHVYHGQYDSFE